MMKSCKKAGKRVRLIALSVIYSLICSIKDNYIVLIPETLPFLFDLLEDFNEEVQESSKIVIKHLESLSGETYEIDD